jgi:ParB family transcriptional regulator, chromosome partitioning protein
MMSNAIQSSIARLGKSLDAYKKDAVLTDIAIGDLVPYANQARETFADEPLLEMADTMKTVGVLYPPLVRPRGNGKYEILDGERRYRAAIIAQLASVPCLVKDVDDAMADKIHMLANIQRENLSTAELTQRVQKDMAAAKGNLAVVAAKYGKSKSWVSKLASIAGGGEAMTSLLTENITADRAVLATVASIERKTPEQARALVARLKAAPASANKREIAEGVAKQIKATQAVKARKATVSADADEPTWRTGGGVKRDLALAIMQVELSPASDYTDEFSKLSKKHGPARLANTTRHPNAVYAIVEFGDSGLTRRTYRADELRLLSVR